MIEFLSDIDTQLLLFFNGIHSPFWDYFMSAFTGKVIWVPMYASILYILLKNFHRNVAVYEVSDHAGKVIFVSPQSSFTVNTTLPEDYKVNAIAANGAKTQVTF